MITDGKKWHYLPVKKLSALYGITCWKLLLFKMSTLFQDRKETEKAQKFRQKL